MQVSKEQVIKEIKEELSKIEDELSKPPNIKGFINNYKELMKENEELDRKLKNSNTIPVSLLFKVLN